MKVLMLTPYLPYPITSGGQTRSYNLIKNLSRRHDITLFSLIKDEKEKKYIGELEKYCKKVRVFRRSKTPWTLRNILLTGLGPFPFLVIRNLSPQERRAVKEELSREKYDLIHAETFYVTPHIPKTDIPVLLVEQTVEYLVYKHYVEKQSKLFMRPLLWLDVLKLKYWETFFWRHAEGVVAMSDSDRKAMKKMAEGLEIDIVPNGIDVDFFSEERGVTKSQPRVLYVGNFTWLQNVEAVEVLVEKVWPKIKKEIADCKLWIVGKNITEEIKALASEEIEITEGISDIRDAYLNATVLVAPIKGPGGTRLKILEAMVSRLPVVTTSVGAEGLGVEGGKEALISDNYAELSKMAIEVIKNKKLASRLGMTGRRFVEKKYAWSHSAALLEKIYNKLVYDK